MNNAPELKPCPFCGNDGTGPIEDALHICHFEHDFRADSWTVQCDKCSATMGYSDSEDEAIDDWNRRADLTPAPSVTVKPLEWEDQSSLYEGGYAQYAITSMGTYVATGKGWFIIGRTQWHDAHDIDAAKAAAQADYEARILAAVQIGPRRATPEALASLRAGEGYATSGAEDHWIEDMKAGVYDDPVALRHQIIEATDPDFIWGALDNVHDADTTLDDYAAAVSRAIRAVLLSAVHVSPAPGWQPIKTAPHDKDILVWYDHDADPYQDPNNPGLLTPYAAWTEGGDFLLGKGICIARHHPPHWEVFDKYGSGHWMPAAWFAHEDNNYERVVNPTHWMPLPAPPSEGVEP